VQIEGQVFRTRRVTPLNRELKISVPLPYSIMPDVEMKTAENKPSDKKIEEEQKPSPPSPVTEIKNNVALLERAVSTLEPRFTHRVLRTLTALRKRINDDVLREAIESIHAKGDYLFYYPKFIVLSNTNR